MTTTNKTIAQSVELLMVVQGKKNKELATLLGITATQASFIRRGATPMNTDQLYAVAGWLGVTTDSLAQGYEVTPVLAAA